MDILVLFPSLYIMNKGFDLLNFQSSPKSIKVHDNVVRIQTALIRVRRRFNRRLIRIQAVCILYNYSRVRQFIQWVK